MQIRVLGPVEIVHQNRRVLLGPQQAALLIALFSEPRRVVPAHRLVDLLWDAEPPAAAAATLRSHVSHLRRALDPEGRSGGQAVLSGVGRGAGAGYVLDVDACHSDAGRFEELYEQARRRLADNRPELCDKLIGQALQLIRGPVLAGVDRPFAVVEAARLTDLIRSARRLRAEALIALGRADDAVRGLSTLLKENDLAETVRESLARALYFAGRTDEAASCCREGVELLQERGLDAPGLSRLQSAILHRELQLPGSHCRTGGSRVPRQLPPDLPHFVGRDEHKSVVADLFSRTDSAPATLLISGLPGVGKTSLAVHLAHTVAHRFPDGQLHAELGGQRTDRPAPEDLIASFLRAFGTPPAEVPSDPAERLQAYRSLLAGKRVLVVLDDAAEEVRVRPLLPSGRGCATIVTSRNSLSGLHGHRIALGVLTPGQALELLTGIVGPERVYREPDQAESIVHRSGLLPLAVWVAGARLATRPSWRLARMASALEDEHRRLDELASGDVTVRAGLELTYRALDTVPRLAFRRLGLLNGGGVAAWELAALLGTTLGRAEKVLDSFQQAHLVEVHATGRYLLHDLVRLFAGEKAADEDSPEETRAALLRLLGCAQDLAEQAARALEPEIAASVLNRAGWWSLGEEAARTVTMDPRAWFERDLDSLLRAVDIADRLDCPRLAGALASDLATYFRFIGGHDDWRRTCLRVLDLGRRTGRPMVRIAMRHSLGDLETIEDRYPEAIEHFQEALNDIEALDERSSVLSHHTAVLCGLGYVYRLVGRYREATEHLQQARDLAGAGFAGAFSRAGLAAVHLECGELDQAKSCYEDAAVLARAHGYRGCEGNAIRGLGLVEHTRGDWNRALMRFEEAHRIALEAGDRLGKTHSAAWRADTLARSGRVDAAIPELQACLETYRSTRNLWGEATVLGMLGYAEELRGNLLAATALMERSIAQWRRLGSPYWVSRHVSRLVSLRARTPAGPGEAGGVHHSS